MLAVGALKKLDATYTDSCVVTYLSTTFIKESDLIALI